MRAVTIDAKSAESALRLTDALKDFDPQLSGDDREGYRVTIDLNQDGHVIAVLDALEEYVTAQNDGPAGVEMDGRRYTVHPRENVAGEAKRSRGR
jgi:hypothetical protein